MRTFPCELARATRAHEVGGDAEPLEIILVERLLTVQVRVRLAPGTAFERSATQLDLVGHHAHCRVVRNRAGNVVRRLASVRDLAHRPATSRTELSALSCVAP
jgi:hypothetical protein